MKIKSFAVFTIAASIMFASCGTSPSGGKLNTDIDSLSYALGISYTNGLIPFLEQNGVDSTQMDNFIKGLLKSASIEADNKKKNAHLIGLQIGQTLSRQFFEGANQQIFGNDSTTNLNKGNFIAGFIAASLNKDMKMNMDDAQAYMMVKTQEIQAKQMAIQAEANKVLYKEHIEQNENFLAENKQKAGVTTTESGLQYQVIKMGRGAKPTMANTVKVHYTGTLIDGTEFDSSVSRGQPAEFVITGVIPGWTEALQLMPVGSKFKLFIPENIAYGANGSGSIMPYSTLIFEVELLEIVR